MTDRWRDCVVTVIDVIGIKGIAQAGGSEASERMRSLHSLAQNAMNLGMPTHSHCYCWNDSILLLAYWDKEHSSGRRLLAEASDLKKRIDSNIGPSYAISMKGRTFPDQMPPPPVVFSSGIDHPRCITLRASSYAMANCYFAEAAAKQKKLRASWYLDTRIARRTGLQTDRFFSVSMLPNGKRRRVYLLDGYIE